MLIEVTQQDIDEGIVEHCYDCPVALALYRATKQLWRVDSPCTIFIDGSTRTYYLPRIAQDFILAFDENVPVEPFSFEIEIPKLTED